MTYGMNVAGQKQMFSVVLKIDSESTMILDSPMLPGKTWENLPNNYVFWTYAIKLLWGDQDWEPDADAVDWAWNAMAGEPTSARMPGQASNVA